MPQKVSFTLDGKKVEANKGLTIWEIANGKGINIPHLCHKPTPAYRPDGNCRACMVEIEGERTLAASCIREPTDGMVVSTDTDRAKSSRKMVVEMLLSDQPEQVFPTIVPAISGIWQSKMKLPKAVCPKLKKNVSHY
jgi:formate dehydrogenase major subunit